MKDEQKNKGIEKRSAQVRRILFFEWGFKRLITLGVLIIVVLICAIVLSLFAYSLPSIRSYGFSFFVSSKWNFPVTNATLTNITVQGAEITNVLSDGGADTANTAMDYELTNLVISNFQVELRAVRLVPVTDLTVASLTAPSRPVTDMSVAGMTLTNLTLSGISLSNAVCTDVTIAYRPSDGGVPEGAAVTNFSVRHRAVADSRFVSYNVLGAIPVHVRVSNFTVSGAVLTDVVYSENGAAVTNVRRADLQVRGLVVTNVSADEVDREYGVLSFMLGTLLTSILALLLALPFSMAVALFLGEYFHTGAVSEVLNSAMELLAGIPSVIYGIIGFFVLAPAIGPVVTGLRLGTAGTSILTASLVLAVMILPYSASTAREVIKMVPNDLKEAAYSLGATRLEVISRVVVPYSSSGIFAGILLAFGRALGETMAVTMVIGNSKDLTFNIFGPGDTIASRIANEFGESSGMKLSALIEIGLVLLVITTLFGLLGRFIIRRMSVRD